MGEDFREGVTCVLSIKMRDIQFEGQTKTKLGNPEIKTEIENIVARELSKLFKQAEYEKTFEVILDKAKQAQRARLASKKAKGIQNSINYNWLENFKHSTIRIFIVEGFLE